MRPTFSATSNCCCLQRAAWWRCGAIRCVSPLLLRSEQSASCAALECMALGLCHGSCLLKANGSAASLDSVLVQEASAASRPHECVPILARWSPQLVLLLLLLLLRSTFEQLDQMNTLDGL